MGDHRLDHSAHEDVREPGRSKIRITALAMAVTGISAAAIGTGAAMTGRQSAVAPVQVSIAVAGATDSAGTLIPVVTTDTSAAVAVGRSPGPAATAPAGSPSGTAPAAGDQPVAGPSAGATAPGAPPQKPVPVSSTGKSVTIGGQLTCSSGSSIEGVWVNAAQGSGYAPWQGASSSAPAKFWYTLPESESYSVHVGCGGSPQYWAVACLGPQVTKTDASFECIDVSGASGYETCKVK